MGFPDGDLMDSMESTSNPETVCSSDTRAFNNQLEDRLFPLTPSNNAHSCSYYLRLDLLVIVPNEPTWFYGVSQTSPHIGEMSQFINLFIKDVPFFSGVCFQENFVKSK